MSRIPFTVYDIFAYLTSGSLLVASLDYLHGPQLLLRDEHTAAVAMFYLFASYIAGHLIAQFSSPVLELIFVARVLLRPSETLLGKTRPVLPYLFPLYYTPLREETQERVFQRARERGFAGSGEALFAHVFGVAKTEVGTAARLEEFRNLYGFARNVSFAFFLVAVLLWIGPADGREGPPRLWALLSLLAAIGMLYRYLKFFRQFSYELFVTYAELRPKGTPS